MQTAAPDLPPCFVRRTRSAAQPNRLDSTQAAIATTKKITPAMRVTGVGALDPAADGAGQALTMGVLQQGQHEDHQGNDQQDNAADNLVNRHV